MTDLCQCIATEVLDQPDSERARQLAAEIAEYRADIQRAYPDAAPHEVEEHLAEVAQRAAALVLLASPPAGRA